MDPDLATMEAALREAFTVPGFIAYTMRSIAQCHPTALVSELPLELARKTGMVPHDSIQEALSWLDAQLGEGPIHILPQGNMTLPILAWGQLFALGGNINRPPAPAVRI